MNVFNRRQFLRTATVVTAAALGSLHVRTHGAVLAPRRTHRLIDTNLTLGRWPLRRLPLDETPALVTKLAAHGVAEAWAGSFDGLLHRDISFANARLAAECRRHGRRILLPFGCINPVLPDWQKDLKKCKQEYAMRGIRLYPNYNGYKLDAPFLAELLDAASEQRMIVQLVMSMEDERMQHPPMQVPHVDASPLPDLLQSRPQLRVVLLNWSRALKAGLLPKLAATGQVWFDIATLEGVGGVANLMKQVPPKQILFGSCAPLFYFESAALKLKESALSDEDLAAIKSGNALALSAPPARVR